MEGKTVVVLPGSPWQIPLVQACKARGLRTLVVDPHGDAAALPYADGGLQSDIFDLERAAQYCRAEHAEAVITDQSDIAVPAAARLGEMLSLPAPTPECARLFTNKFEMRSFCTAHGLPCPEYRLCRTGAEVERFMEELRAPVVVKPLDSCSSRGVFTISRREDVGRFFEQSLSFSRADRAVLAERYIEGTEFTVDGIKTPERHYSLAVSEKRHFPHNPNVACDLYFSHQNDHFDYGRLSSQNDRLVEQSPLNWGLTHAEYKFENGTFYLIEIGARGGGNLISSHIVPYLSGFDPYQYLLNCSLGNISSPGFFVPEQYKNRCAVLHFFDVPQDGGVISRIDGLELLLERAEIAAYQFNVAPGDVIKRAKTDSDRAGFYIACCETERELSSLMEEIHQKVRIVC